uniref:chitinase n=1 Tax=Chilo suppressalis TaxID=168631 RepID=A0A0S2MU14_CHISP|nr:chitinase 2 [Chilo suppressalis]
MKVLLLVALLSALSAVYASKKVVICYYGTWAVNRPGLGKFGVEDINPYLCTHIIYAFAGIDTNGTVIPLDVELDINMGNYRNFTDLKKKNPKLKPMLAVGGWAEGSAKYSEMAADPAKRQNFIQSALDIIFEYDFEGFDLDWEYPNRRDTVHGVDDIENFSQLVKEMREEFDEYGLILTAAVSSFEASASQSYNVSAISQYLHYVNLMTYDMYGPWETLTGHNAGLHKGDFDGSTPREQLFTADVAVEYWLRDGCPPEKLALGVPFYGHSFKLQSETNSDVRAPSNGAGIAGPYTGEAGFVGYNEFCAMLKSDPSWSIRKDHLAKVPYAVKGLDWVSYDNPRSIRDKVKYALKKKLAGIMIWSIETDDFHNVCGGGAYTLLKVINNALYKKPCL